MKQEQKPLKIVFFGNECLATGTTTKAPVLSALHEHGHDIKLVVVNTHQVTSRQNRSPEMIDIAGKLDLPIATPQKLDEIADTIRALKPDIAVLAAYGRIIPQSIIDLFPHGIINIHPSLLPKYRGSTPIETALLDGECETGVTIMQVTAAMDAGPIYAQAKFAVDNNTTKQQLADQLLNIGRDLIIDLLPKIVAGTSTPKPQDDSQATYTKLIKKSDGRLDSAKSAQQLAREVIAYASWPTSYFDYNHGLIKILEAKASNFTCPPDELAKHEGKLYFGCNKGSLQILRLQVAGKTPVLALDFINAQRDLKAY